MTGDADAMGVALLAGAERGMRTKRGKLDKSMGFTGCVESIIMLISIVDHS